MVNGLKAYVVPFSMSLPSEKQYEHADRILVNSIMIKFNVGETRYNAHICK